MDKSYHNLFIELCHATEIAAEQVMEYDHNQGDSKGEEVAQLMRDDYIALGDKLKEEQELEKADYTKLLAGAYIVSNNLNDKIINMQKAVRGYDTDLIPKLKDVIDNSTSNAEANNKANIIFVTKKEN